MIKGTIRYDVFNDALMPFGDIRLNEYLFFNSVKIINITIDLKLLCYVNTRIREKNNTY